MSTEADKLTRRIKSVTIAASRLADTWADEGVVYPGHVDTLIRLVAEMYPATGRTAPGEIVRHVSDEDVVTELTTHDRLVPIPRAGWREDPVESVGGLIISNMTGRSRPRDTHPIYRFGVTT